MHASDAILSQDLTEYRKLRLPHIEPGLRLKPEALGARIGEILSEAGNTPFEIIGSAPLFFLLPLFWKLRHIATEIVVRPKESSPGYVVYSIIDDGVIRPASVLDGLLDLAIIDLKGGAAVKASESITVDLEKVWGKANGKTGSEKIADMLSKVGVAVSAAKRVVLKGEASAIPAICLVNFLAVLGKKVSYDKISFITL